MGWKAQVSDSLTSFNVEIRLANVYHDDMHVMRPDGTVETVRVGSEVPPVLSLPREAVEALRDALNGHAPPSSEADLREALEVERGRVDRILSAPHRTKG